MYFSLLKLFSIIIFLKHYSITFPHQKFIKKKGTTSNIFEYLIILSYFSNYLHIIDSYQPESV